MPGSTQAAPEAAPGKRQSGGHTASNILGSQSNVLGPLAAHHERDVLAHVGHAIGPQYLIGSATRWYKAAQSQAEKRLAEWLAGIVYEASTDDSLARQVATAAARHTALHDPALLPVLLQAATAHALGLVDEQIAFVATQYERLRATRSRAALTEISTARHRYWQDLCEIHDQIDDLRKRIDKRQSAVDAGACNRAQLTEFVGWTHQYERLWRAYEKRRAQLPPAYRLTPEKRKKIEASKKRLQALRAARQRLKTVLGRLDKGRAV